ncbi:MAG: hypothetical protein QM770_09375 [Tepidisphaeraceae bacterium]
MKEKDIPASKWLRRRWTTVSRAVALTLLASTVTGCIADAFERDADRQVKALVKDRQQTVLGYSPSDGTVGSPTQRTPTTRTYQSVPTTQLPPLGSEAIMLRQVRRQVGTLGPRLDDEPGTPSLPTSGGVERARRYVTEGYTLGPPAELGRTVQFSLFDCLHYATNHSRNYQDRVERLYEAALDVTLQRHLFEPRPFASVGARYNGGQADVNYRSALTVTSQVGVRQRLPYGGEVVASALVDFVNALNTNTQDGESTAWHSAGRSHSCAAQACATSKR